MENTYPYRMMQFFKDETKGEHLQRMRRAATSGIYEPKPTLTSMIVEQLVEPEKIKALVNTLGNLHMRLVDTKGFGKNSFFIEQS